MVVTRSGRSSSPPSPQPLPPSSHIHISSSVDPLDAGEPNISSASIPSFDSDATNSDTLIGSKIGFEMDLISFISKHFNLTPMNLKDLSLPKVSVSTPSSSENMSDPAPAMAKASFASIFRKPVIDVSSLPIPVRKGETICVTIPEETYLKSVQKCEDTCIIGRYYLPKGSTPVSTKSLKTKLAAIWIPKGKFVVTPIGRGFYNIRFETREEMIRIRNAGNLNLKPGTFNLRKWVPNFNPYKIHNSHTEVWVRLHGLPQELWETEMLMSIAGGVGTPILADSNSLDWAYGHYARVLVKVDLSKPLENKILVEIQNGGSIHVKVDYERLPGYCTHCAIIGHMNTDCRHLKQKISSSDTTILGPFKPLQGVLDSSSHINDTPAGVEDSPISKEQVEGARSVSPKVSHLEPEIPITTQLEDKTASEKPLMDTTNLDVDTPHVLMPVMASPEGKPKTTEQHEALIDEESEGQHSMAQEFTRVSRKKSRKKNSYASYNPELESLFSEYRESSFS